MNTAEQSGGPRFATMADLEALEGRIINRVAESELRLARDVSTAFWRQVLALGAIVIGFGIAILNRLGGTVTIS